MDANNNNDILTKEENKVIAEYEKAHQEAVKNIVETKQIVVLCEWLYKKYIQALIKNNLWARGASDQPDIVAFNKYKDYRNYLYEQAKILRVSPIFYAPQIKDKRAYVVINNYIEIAKNNIEVRQAKEKRDYENVALTGNNEITNTLLKINTSKQTPHNNNITQTGQPVYFERDAHPLDKDGRLNVQLQVANWCNGYGLHLLLIIYDKLVRQAKRTTTGDKIAYVYEQSLKDFKSNKGHLIEIPISDIEKIMGIQYTKYNRDALRKNIEKASEEIIGVYFKITGELSGWDTLVYRMLYNRNTKNYEILVSSFMQRWAEIGAYFPVHKEIFKLDCRNPYASPLYVKLCEQINYPQANKARLDGYKNSIRIKTLLKGIGLDKAYTLSKDATQIKESLVKALEALSKEAKGFEWVITGDGLATRTMNDFNKLWLCFNLPNVEKFARKTTQVLEIPVEAPAPENA